MNFLKDFRPFIDDLIKERPKLIVVGDYNIVHGNMDIHNPKRRDNPSGFRPEERKWMDDWFDQSFEDAFRKSNPVKQEFSWWSYRAGSRGKNKGWRIDYISVSKMIANRIVNSGHYTEDNHSDHCCVWLTLENKEL
jgi:exodeoxyribonuclease-3